MTAPRSDAAVRKRRPYRRDQIIRAAIDLFHERGFAATSMDDIGAAVGLTGPSIYRHFAGKSEILEAALAEPGSAFLEAFDRLLESEMDPLERLTEMVRIYADALVEDPALTAVSGRERSQLNEETRQSLNRVDRQVVTKWVTVLAEQRPELEPSEARLIIKGSFDLALGMAVARTSLGRQRVSRLIHSAMLHVLLETRQ